MYQKLFVMLPRNYYILLSTLLFKAILITSHPNRMIINVPVANLTTSPSINKSITLPAGMPENKHQASQLLLGEPVVAYQDYVDTSSKKWLQVAALGHYNYDQPSWQTKLFWIPASQATPEKNHAQYNFIIREHNVAVLSKQNKKICTLSIGSRVKFVKMDHNRSWIILANGIIGHIPTTSGHLIERKYNLSLTSLRNNLKCTAFSFLGFPYCWGGRSSYDTQRNVSSVDCSGFVNLIFATQGLVIPRTSRDQYASCIKIHLGKKLQTGDLIFLGQDEKNISHVMMFLEPDLIIESALSLEKVAITSCKDRFGQPMKSLKSGSTVQTINNGKKYKIFFGTFCHNAHQVQALRNEFFESCLG